MSPCLISSGRDIKMETVAFISCVNDQALYDQCCGHIHVLDKTGFHFEMCPVQNQHSMTAAYNAGMRKSASKYKVYLHQDTFIRNVHFLRQINNIFKSNPLVGMIGMMGGKHLNMNSNPLLVWNCPEKWGSIFNLGNNRIEQRYNPAGIFEPVDFIDGCIMVTQYDIPWREDLFAGFHFYDLSQSIEFRKRGYLVVIPRQETPWCAHISTSGAISPGYQRMRRTFVREYHQFLVPPGSHQRKGIVKYQGKKYRVT